MFLGRWVFGHVECSKTVHLYDGFYLVPGTGRGGGSWFGTIRQDSASRGPAGTIVRTGWYFYKITVTFTTAVDLNKCHKLVKFNPFPSISVHILLV